MINQRSKRSAVDGRMLSGSAFIPFSIDFYEDDV
jgi:hypothetical protein